MLSALDIKYLMRELKFLEGAIFDKVYQPSRKEFVIQLHKSGEGKKLLKIIAGESIFLTTNKGEFDNPSGFVMFLRKNLEQQRIEKIEQKDFERIVEITLSKGFKIILELFSKGNFILVDEKDKIIACLEEQEWKDREVKKGKKYEYPPSRENPFKMNTSEFQRILNTSEKDNVVKSLAVDFSLSGKYAEEICKKAKVIKKRKKVDVNKIFSQIQVLNSCKIKANIVKFGDSMAVNPIEMFIYEDEAKEYFKTFNEALDYYYSNIPDKELLKDRKRIEDTIEKQKDNLKELEKRSKDYKIIGDIIYANYNLIDNIINDIKEKKWNVKNKLIKEMKKDERKVILNIDGHDIAINIIKKVTDNASFYYDVAKKSRKKIENARKAIEEFIEKAKKSKTKKDVRPKTARKKEWYEKFRWFITSEGKLAVGGRDATTNDIVVKKYVEKDDLVFHTEAPGSPFVVIKSEGKEILENEKQEAAQFCASNSRAWGNKLTVSEVYAFGKSQIKKEFGLPKGTFMIYGEREYFKPILEQAVGLAEDGRVMGGPLSAVKKHCKSYVVVRQGDEKKSDIAKKIKFLIKADDLNEVMQALPPGDCRIIK